MRSAHVPYYCGCTERGRMVAEDSLSECVRSLAHAANVNPDEAATVQRGEREWAVYAFPERARRGRRRHGLCVVRLDRNPIVSFSC